MRCEAVVKAGIGIGVGKVGRSSIAGKCVKSEDRHRIKPGRRMEGA